MESRLEQYIDLVRDIASESLPAQLSVPMIVAESKKLVAGPVELNHEQRQPAASGHGRHLLYSDPTSDFVVMAMVWPAGADSLPHNHDTWGVVAVLEGELEITEYAPPVEGQPLATTGTTTAGPGAVGFVIPPERDLHRMRNNSDRPAITIHTYGQALEQCQTFDEATSTSKTLKPQYTSSVDSSAMQA